MSLMDKYRAGHAVTFMDKANSCASLAELIGFKKQADKTEAGTAAERQALANRIVQMQKDQSG